MKRKLLRAAAALMTILIIAGMSLCTAGALTFSNDVETYSEAILLVSLDTGQPVIEQNADKRMYPASTTKIMTYIVACENVADPENTRVTVKQSIIDSLNDTGSSMAYLSDHVGEEVSFIDLLYSMMVPSGNDAALTLADYIGNGDIQAFVDKMNAKAKELGCENTHFTNPDGLHDDNHYTTARDLLKITQYAQKLPYFEEISNTVTYTCEGDEDALITTNYLIDPNTEYYYSYARGIKTGTTDEAGRCLVTTASADGQSYILVLLGAPYEEGSEEEYYTFLDAAGLFRWCLTQLEPSIVFTTQSPICEVTVSNAQGGKAALVPEKSITSVLPKGYTQQNIVVEPSVPAGLQAPLSKDETVGTASIYYYDKQSGEKQLIEKVKVRPAADVLTVDGEKPEKAESGESSVNGSSKSFFEKYLLYIIIGGAVVLAVVIIIICVVVAKKKKSGSNDDGRHFD